VRLDDNWVRTGDLGELLANRTLKVIGRKENALKLSEEEVVFFDQLEFLYTASPFVAEVFIPKTGHAPSQVFTSLFFRWIFSVCSLSFFLLLLLLLLFLTAAPFCSCCAKSPGAVQLGQGKWNQGRSLITV